MTNSRSLGVVVVASAFGAVLALAPGWMKPMASVSTSSRKMFLNRTAGAPGRESGIRGNSPEKPVTVHSFLRCCGRVVRGMCALSRVFGCGQLSACAGLNVRYLFLLGGWVKNVQAGVSPGFDGQDEQTQKVRRKCHLPLQKIPVLSQKRVGSFGGSVIF